MIRQQIVALLLTLAVTGCSFLSPSTQVIPQSFQPAPEDIDLDQPFSSKFDQAANQLAQTDLRAGQDIELWQVEINPAEKGQRDEPSVNMTHYLGTIASVDSQNVILKDAVQIIEGRTERGVPILSRVPYVSRMFSSTGVGRTSIRLADDVTIPRDRIANAFELSPTGVETLQELQQFERIGVDFE